MPMFEFKCSKCGHKYEELVVSTTAYSVRCPECDSPEAERLISSFSAGSSVSSASSGNPCGDCTQFG